MGSRLTLVSIVVATLAMASSFFQSFNYSRNLDVVQRNVLRGEYLRTCRDIIDAYFQIRLRAMAMHEAHVARATEGVDAAMRRDAEANVFKFGALGTFLANFRDDAVRQRYTELSWKLLAIVRETYAQPREPFDRAYAEADGLFGEMNEDCARTARLMFL